MTDHRSPVSTIIRTVSAPAPSVVVALETAAGSEVAAGQRIGIVEAMKMQMPVTAPAAGRLLRWHVAQGDSVGGGQALCELAVAEDAGAPAPDQTAVDATDDTAVGAGVAALRRRLAQTGDTVRGEQAAARHARGGRTARENLADLVDAGSFDEYGQLAVAAQRGRRPLEALQQETAADGVITGIGRIDGIRAVVIINDYSVLAGTQGYFHHRKIDRALALARRQRLPVVMYCEGGGGRPGDTDVLTQVAGLDLGTFAAWAGLRGVVPRIAIAHGYCFAGNAALFGAADLTIATDSACIGMAGPAMIEGGGLGRYHPKEIGPVAVQAGNGVVDVRVADEAEATATARRALSLLCAATPGPGHADTAEAAADSGPGRPLSDPGTLLPADRRLAYDIHPILAALADRDSLLPLRSAFGAAVVTALGRMDGRPVAFLASDCRHLGGAIDAEAADKAADFLALGSRLGLPVVSLIDSPGFMVGPDSEAQGAVRRMARLFAEGAQLSTPLVAIVLRRAYGLGAMALAGGSLHRPVYCAAWPSGEFGAMGLEGAVRLGYRKELEAAAAGAERQALFDRLLAEAYARGQATEMAAHLEIDAVIEPRQTRAAILRALQGDARPERRSGS